jgi:hypothetical protein
LAEVPVLSILTDWRDVIAELPSKGFGRIILADAGHIFLAYKDGQVQVWSDVGGARSHDTYVNFKAGIEKSIVEYTGMLKNLIPRIFDAFPNDLSKGY